MPCVQHAVADGSMNSSQERALFEEYGWVYDHIARRWNNHNGTVWVGIDFIVALTKERGGDLELMRAIVQCGRPPTTIGPDEDDPRPSR